jgi:hypothetical protein
LASKSCLLLGRVTDLKDRSLAEHNFERVNYMSILYLLVLTAAGLAQVQLPVIPASGHSGHFDFSAVSVIPVIPFIPGQFSIEYLFIIGAANSLQHVAYSSNNYAEPSGNENIFFKTAA